MLLGKSREQLLIAPEKFFVGYLFSLPNFKSAAALG